MLFLLARLLFPIFVVSYQTLELLTRDESDTILRRASQEKARYLLLLWVVSVIALAITP